MRSAHSGLRISRPTRNDRTAIGPPIKEFGDGGAEDAGEEKDAKKD
jgi:hypothetical protein